jgi:hypothetical protein
MVGGGLFVRFRWQWHEQAISTTMQRRALIGGMALASGGLLVPSAAAIADQAPPNSGLVSVKDPQFGAIGDFRADDTEAIQAAADYCFGSPTDPHGTAKVSANRVLQFPPGTYKMVPELLVREDLLRKSLMPLGVLYLRRTAAGILISRGCISRHPTRVRQCLT